MDKKEFENLCNLFIDYILKSNNCGVDDDFMFYGGESSSNASDSYSDAYSDSWD